MHQAGQNGRRRTEIEKGEDEEEREGGIKAGREKGEDEEDREGGREREGGETAVFGQN